MDWVDKEREREVPLDGPGGTAVTRALPRRVAFPVKCDKACPPNRYYLQIAGSPVITLRSPAPIMIGISRQGTLLVHQGGRDGGCFAESSRIYCY